MLSIAAAPTQLVVDAEGLGDSWRPLRVGTARNDYIRLRSSCCYRPLFFEGVAMTGMQYLTYLEPVSLDSLRLDHSPRDGMAVIHICFYALLRGETGRYFNVMRGLPHPTRSRR